MVVKLSPRINISRKQKVLPTASLYVNLLYFHANFSSVQAQFWHDPTMEEEYREKSIFLADLNQENVRKHRKFFLLHAGLARNQPVSIADFFFQLLMQDKQRRKFLVSVHQRDIQWTAPALGLLRHGAIYRRKSDSTSWKLGEWIQQEEASLWNQRVDFAESVLIALLAVVWLLRSRRQLDHPYSAGKWTLHWGEKARFFFGLSNTLFLAKLFKQTKKTQQCRYVLRGLFNLSLETPEGSLEFFTRAKQVPKLCIKKHRGEWLISCVDFIVFESARATIREFWKWLFEFQDKLGLRVLDEAEKLHFLTKEGGHMNVPEEWFKETIVEGFL